MELQTALNTGVALLWILMLLRPHGLQCQAYYAARPIYIAREAPSVRLRRFEYSPAAYAGYIAHAAGPPPVPHYQQTPGFQLLNYQRPHYQALAQYQQQQPPLLPAPPAPVIYTQPSQQYQQRVITPHAELAKHRYEGNYIERVPQTQRRIEQPLQPAVAYQPLQQQQLHHRALHQPELYNVPPALFSSDVLHVIPRAARQQEQQLQTARKRRSPTTQLDALAAASKPAAVAVAAQPAKQTRYYHDIFMRFAGPRRSFGHVLQQPGKQEQRFETQHGTNRYKGEVIWTDRQGGHAEHRWDLAQGKL